MCLHLFKTGIKSCLMSKRSRFDPSDPRFFVRQIFVAGEDFLNS